VVYRANNGSLTPTDSLFLIGNLNPDSVFVVVNPSAYPAIQIEGDTTHTLCFYNGDDAVLLIKISTGDTLDIIGEVGVDPGSGWPVGTGATNNYTLIRKIEIQQGSTDWATGSLEWDVFPIDMADSLGAHTMTPCTFSTPGCNTDLFFSEYIEGSSSNKALEIYNPTDNDIDLSDYVVYRANNGSLTPTDSLFLIGNLNPDSVFVVVNPSAYPAIQIEGDTTHTLCFYNGDDAVLLIKISTGDTLDIIGEVGVDPGSGWPVGTGATNNYTLIRKIEIQQGSTDWATGSLEWDVFPIDMADSLGAHTMTPCVGGCALSFSYVNVTECGSYLSPSGNYTWSSSNTYTDTIPNAANCDSVITINLTINSVDSSVTQVGSLLTADQSGAAYQWLDCAGMTPIVGAIGQSYTGTTNGNYAVIVTNNGCSDTSLCHAVIVTGIIENDFGTDLIVYPNPTDGNFSIDLGALSNTLMVTMTDLRGRVIQTLNYRDTRLIKMTIEEPKGVYLLLIESGNKKAIIRLVKE